jgi:nucleoside-diphosphate-sugar epimerase
MSAPPFALEGGTVLVTGAGGFVGPHLGRALAARGARVEGLTLGGDGLDPAFARAWCA